MQTLKLAVCIWMQFVFVTFSLFIVLSAACLELRVGKIANESTTQKHSVFKSKVKKLQCIHAYTIKHVCIQLLYIRSEVK